MKLFKPLFALLLAGLVASCMTAAAPRDSLDAIARDYVQMTLEIGEREQGYVDAYYGPPEWQAAARANTRTLPQLAEAAAALDARLAAIQPAGLDALSQRRLGFLKGQITAARTRLRMAQGERLTFEEEARGLFGVTPELRPLSSYDAVLARLETIVPGTGPLAERLEAFQSRFTIPRERLDAVMREAIAECRRRTLQHIPLPAEEQFTLELVTNKSWSGYNWYQGQYRSLIQINTDQPVRIGRAVDLGCHEGYPGHHAYNVLLERDLARGRGWVEFMVYPLYSPQSLIAEGSANYGYELAFPGAERLEYETRALYPLAGLSPEGARDYLALQDATQELAGARFTIARDYLNGTITREQALALAQRYQLLSPSRAEQSLAFTDQYRSYVINYGLGRDIVARWIEAQGTSQQARWDAMERLLSQPTVPSDLMVGR